MRVFLTGGTGFVGSHAAEQLLLSGHQVTLLVRNLNKAKALFQSLGCPMPTFIHGSLTDEATIREAIEACDAVVHSAGITPLKGVSEDELIDTNVNGVKVVLGAACEFNKKSLFISSVTAIFHTGPGKIHVNADIANSSHAYGKSKAEAESVVRQLQEAGHPVISLYPGGIIGPRDPSHSASMMALCYRLTDSFRVTSGGLQQIDVRDLANIIVGVLEAEKTDNRLLTVGHYYPWLEFADMVESIIGKPLNRVETSGAFLRMIGRLYDLKRRFTDVDSPVSAETMRYTTQWPEIENSNGLGKLGLGFRPMEETLRDTIAWLCEERLLSEDAAPAICKNIPSNRGRTAELV